MEGNKNILLKNWDHFVTKYYTKLFWNSIFNALWSVMH